MIADFSNSIKQATVQYHLSVQRKKVLTQNPIANKNIF
jgi:hypothetical protein